MEAASGERAMATFIAIRYHTPAHSRTFL